MKEREFDKVDLIKYLRYNAFELRCYEVGSMELLPDFSATTKNCKKYCLLSVKCFLETKI